MSTFTVVASSANESAISATPNSSARGAATRPEATGRAAVRSPISLSMSASITWLSALEPPQASARPTIVARNSQPSGQPSAPTNMPAAPVSSSSVMIRGFVSVT